jgi:hypothetical protein
MIMRVLEHSRRSDNFLDAVAAIKIVLVIVENNYGGKLDEIFPEIVKLLTE